MSTEIGKVFVGTVTGIKDFGAFIKLPDGKTGLCHISEISSGYVKDVKSVLSEQQEVKVKVLAIDERGKVRLSIKQAEQKASSHEGGKRQGRPPQQGTAPKVRTRREEKPAFRSKNKPEGFEDMLSSFMKDSEKKLSGMKKTSRNRKGNGYNR